MLQLSGMLILLLHLYYSPCWEDEKLVGVTLIFASKACCVPTQLRSTKREAFSSSKKNPIKRGSFNSCLCFYLEGNTFLRWVEEMSVCLSVCLTVCLTVFLTWSQSPPVGFSVHTELTALPFWLSRHTWYTSNYIITCWNVPHPHIINIFIVLEILRHNDQRIVSSMWIFRN